MLGSHHQEWVSPEPLGWGVGWQVLSRIWVPVTEGCSGHEEAAGRQRRHRPTELTSARVLHTISWLLSSVPEPEVTCSLMYSLPLDIDGSVGRAPSKEGALVDSYSKTGAFWDVSGVYPAESLSSHIELPAVMASPLSCPLSLPCSLAPSSVPPEWGQEEKINGLYLHVGIRRRMTMLSGFNQTRVDRKAVGKCPALT